MNTFHLYACVSVCICVFANCNHINVIHSQRTRPQTQSLAGNPNHAKIPLTQWNRKHLPTCRQHFEEQFLILSFFFFYFCALLFRWAEVLYIWGTPIQNEIHASLHTIRHKCYRKLATNCHYLAYVLAVSIYSNIYHVHIYICI